MLCISINQESRRFALADMLNAGRFGDLLELRLDRFGKAPDVGELLANKPKPLIMTCRRTEDGGFWDGSEDERLAILRQCVISKADYVELELDIADDVRRYGTCKRIISYTNLKETPADIIDIYDQARAKNPDIIKLVTLARTPEEAWPLVQILAKSSVPTAIVGLGRANTMLALLGRKIGAPWIYAALERGMEAYPGQPTIDDLHAIYHVGEIQKSTRFLGIVGHGPRELALASCLNAAFAAIEMNLRCLPLEIGSLKTFRKLIDIAKLAGVVINNEHQESVLELEPTLHGAARTTKAVDLLVSKDDTLHGFHKGAKVWVSRLSEILRLRFGGNKPLKDRVVMLVGPGPSARLLAEEVKNEGGIAILASHQKTAGQEFAKESGCRHIAFEALYTTLHDVLVVCDREGDKGKETTIHPGYLQPGIVVMDLTADLMPSQLLREAKARSAAVAPPVEIFLDQALELARMLTSKPIDRDVLARAIPTRYLDDE
jgi:3-dehydroquinate dehydratase/shikimate dehydrogenase